MGAGSLVRDLGNEEHVQLEGSTYLNQNFLSTPTLVDLATLMSLSRGDTM